MKEKRFSHRFIIWWRWVGEKRTNKIHETPIHSEKNVFIWKPEVCTIETDTHTRYVSGDIFCSVNELECSLIEFMQRINPIICNRRKENIFFNNIKKKEILSFALFRLHTDDLKSRYNCVFLMCEHCLLLVLPNYRQIRSMIAM